MSFKMYLFSECYLLSLSKSMNRYKKYVHDYRETTAFMALLEE